VKEIYTSGTPFELRKSNKSDRSAIETVLSVANSSLTSWEDPDFVLSDAGPSSSYLSPSQHFASISPFHNVAETDTQNSRSITQVTDYRLQAINIAKDEIPPQPIIACTVLSFGPREGSEGTGICIDVNLSSVLSSGTWHFFLFFRDVSVNASMSPIRVPAQMKRAGDSGQVRASVPAHAPARVTSHSRYHMVLAAEQKSEDGSVVVVCESNVGHFVCLPGPPSTHFFPEPDPGTKPLESSQGDSSTSLVTEPQPQPMLRPVPDLAEINPQDFTPASATAKHVSELSSPRKDQAQQKLKNSGLSVTRQRVENQELLLLSTSAGIQAI
jgi:hypothetical protein